MAYGDDTTIGSGIGTGGGGGKQTTGFDDSGLPIVLSYASSNAISRTTKSVTYSQADNTLLLDISASVSESAAKTEQIRAVRVRNDGYVPAHAIFGFTKYVSDSDTSEATEYVNFLLNPKEEIMIPATKGIIATTNELYDGTPVTASAPDSNMYEATGSGCSGLDNTTDPVTFTTVGARHRLEDLIRVENEVMEVTAISGDNVTVKRAMFGSTVASHSDGVDVRFPFFNAYHDFDKFSGSQTDSLGRWKSKNFFGKGRTDSGLNGVTAGSVAIQFYESGYQSLGLNGINANTETGLASGIAYEFDIQVDGATNFDNLSFTTDSSDTTFGNVITKIATALDTQYYTAGNLFEKKVHVSLSGGDLVFQSGTSLSTSAISLANADGGTNFWGVGRIPAIANINAAVAARLAQESVYDPVTNASAYKQIFIRDDGQGGLIWNNRQRCGSINYESGAISWILPEKSNAEFVFSCMHTSPFSGKLVSNTGATDNRGNSLVAVYGNTSQQKCEARLTVEAF